MGDSHCRLRVAISRLWVVVLVHRNFCGDRRVVGRSIIVGRIIFSIVVGLGCVGGLSHGFGWRLLVLLGLCQLRRPRR